MKEFGELDLKRELLGALGRIGFTRMTEVQEKAIPLLLQHKDLIVRSKTGSGKTGAFVVPIVQSIEHRGYPQALVIVPTRELALQVASVADKLGRSCGIRSVVVYGGASINVQIQGLNRGADFIIGTPGRILDLIDRRALRIDRLRFLVLDEADLMLDMGFIDDIELIISKSPKDRQTVLMSATMPYEITEIAKKHMKDDAVKLVIGNDEELVVTTITHSYFVANGRSKFSALLAYIDKFSPKKCIIFTSTQRESEYVHRFLVSNGFPAIVMHGGLTQAKRERSLGEFRTRSQFLISTNLASRGLDIPDISDIINFDAPDDPKVYVHRVGRSARMGKNGRAFTIFGYDQEDLMKAINRTANIKMRNIDLNIDGFRNVKLPYQERRRKFSRDREHRVERGRGRPSYRGGSGGTRRRHEYGGSR